MDHATIEEENVVEHYLLGQLPAAEAARFEEHYLDCAECLEKLELSRRLHQGLKQIAAEEGTKTVVRSAILVWLWRHGRALQAALALALGVAVILPWAVLAPELARLRGSETRLASELAQALAPQVQTATFSLSPERSGPGEEPSTRITVGARPEWVALALQLPPDSTAAREGYEARLLAESGEVRWQSGQIWPDPAGKVTLSVHTSWLAPGSHVLELAERAADGGHQDVTRFSFQVRHQE